MLVRVESDSALTLSDLEAALSGTIRGVIGDLGLSRLEHRIIRYDRENILMVRCRREHAHEMRSALLFVSEINKAKVSMAVIKVSGTVKGLARRLRASTRQ